MDFLHPSLDTSFSSAWTLGLEWNGPRPVEPSGPTIAPQNPAVWLLGRRGGFWRSRAYVMIGWVSFPYGCQSFLDYPWHAPSVSAYKVHRHHSLFFGDNADRFGIQKAYSMAPLWSGADLEIEGSLGNWVKFILLDIPSLNSVCSEFPQISPSI